MLLRALVTTFDIANSLVQPGQLFVGTAPTPGVSFQVDPSAVNEPDANDGIINGTSLLPE